MASSYPNTNIFMFSWTRQRCFTPMKFMHPFLQTMCSICSMAPPYPMQRNMAHCWWITIILLLAWMLSLSSINQSMHRSTTLYWPDLEPVLLYVVPSLMTCFFVDIPRCSFMDFLKPIGLVTLVTAPPLVLMLCSLGHIPISWSSKKQRSITHYSTEIAWF